MVYSLFGENEFIINLELQKTVRDLLLKNFEIYRYNFDDKEPSINILSQIKNNIDTLDLFSHSKALIIRNLSEKDFPKKELNPLLESLQKIEKDETILIFFISQKQLTFISKLKLQKQEYKKLDKNDLSDFINEVSKQQNVKLSIKAKSLLTSFFGDDIGIIYNEIIKLSNYKPEIKDTDILDLIKEPNLSNIFGLTDAISEKNKSLAIKLLFQEYNSGTFDLLIFGTITSQIRNAILIKEHKKSPITKLDIHPYVQKKLTNFVNSFDLKQLKLMYSRLFKYDLQIKKGKITPMLALELFITDNI
jgi:DNA polymerase III delta subunit